MTQATAIQLGLVPGFALQDGDLLAELLQGGGGAGGGGGLGLGNTANPATNLTGSSNQNQTGAFVIATSVIVITTITATSNSLILPSGTPIASIIRIYNQPYPGTPVNTAYVFPPVGGTIDGAAVNNSVNLAAGASCDYLYLGNNAWISDLLGSRSA